MEPLSPLLQLPDPALQAVLQQLSTHDVLSAARACSQLRAAAAAALDSIAAGTWHQRFLRLDSVLLYLEHHGQHVSSLDMYMAGSAHLASLPPSCTRLQALSFAFGRVQLGASDGEPGVLQTTSAPTSLQVDRSEMTDSPQGAAAAVARLTRLQRLELECCRFAGGGVLPGSMLAPLTALTHLKLWSVGGWLQAATLEQLSKLRGLQALQLSGDTPGPALTALQHLQQLTALELRRVHSIHLSGLINSLQRLELWNCHDLEPQALAACPQLRHLVLDGCTLAGGSEEGRAALLAHLQQCTQLTYLYLSSSLGVVQQAAAYGALTASSSLEVLYLGGCPPAAWQPMFGGSKHLPRLRELRLNIYGAGAAPADLPALARCCPALQCLHLSGLQGTGTAGLLPLTALTGLTSLFAQWKTYPMKSYDADTPLADFQTPPGQRPDVASQLHKRILELQAASKGKGQ